MPLTSPSPDGVQIWFTTDGDPAGEPLLMIMGLGTQYLGWDDELVARLVDRGCFVIRHDNRDVGHSSVIPVDEAIDVVARVVAAAMGEAIESPYLLSDMAADSVRVLDELGLPAAHVIGASMGGMIAQTLAIEHPERVLTLTSVMSTTGDPTVGAPDPSVLGPLLADAPTTMEEAMERAEVVMSTIGSPGLVDLDLARRQAVRAWERSTYTTGLGHQLVAIAASGDRTEQLRQIQVPTLVIHGDADPLVTLSGGQATADAIPGARLVVVPGMGHDVPKVHWDTLIDEVAALISRVPSSKGA